MLSADRAYTYAYNNYQNFLAVNKKAEEVKKAEEDRKREEAKRIEEAKKANELKKTKAASEKIKKDSKKTSKGKAPSIKLSLTKAGKIRIKVSDKDRDISFVRYAVGNKNISYFNKGKKGIKLVLNTKNEKILKLKKGLYTFYAVDKKGNRTIRVVSIE